jgi:pyruvate formate lyase activating enzyme
VAFLQGCPWRCNYCHNYSILDPHLKGQVSFPSVIKHLEKRYGLLDGLVFSGGEPTMQTNLSLAIQTIKNMEFAVGLHTGGAYPANLKKTLPLIDWIGFDIKAPPNLYQAITQNLSAWDNAKKSIDMVLQSNVDVQFRTTIDPTVMSKTDITFLQEWVKTLGINNLVLQEVRNMGVNPEYKIKLEAIKQPQ